MNRAEFLSILEKNLKVHQSEKQEIIADYQEHFDMGLSKGRSESEICDSLGHPARIAKNYTANALVEMAQKDRTAKNYFKAVLAIFGLGFFNLIVGLPILIMLFTILIVFFSISAGIFIGGLGMIVGGFASIFIHSVPGLIFLIGIFGGLGLMAFGTLMIIGSAQLTKWLFAGLLKYLKANINIIKEG